MAPRANTHSKKNWLRRGWKVAASVVATGAMLLSGIAPANAVGPAVLSLEIAPVHAATGAPIATAGVGQNNNQIAYRVAYSCSTATCTGATVTLPATQLDPTYGTQRLLSYANWTPPAGGGATISGTAATGLTVNLGDVPAGTSSTFLVVYAYPANSGYTTVASSAYFPPDFQIQQSATIASENATGPVTADAAAVTWQIPIPSPAITKYGPVSVRPDTNVAYSLYMNSGCFVYGGSGRIVADGSQLCAESFTVVDDLPEQAVFVSATGGGTYNAADHTVVWEGSGVNAAGGWGSSSRTGWVTRGPYAPRTVTVQYPASAFPEADGGADFIVPVTNEARVDVTYLDAARTTKTATTAATHDVARITPFGRATQGKDTTADYTSGGRRYVDVPPVVTGMTCPDSGTDPWARQCTPGQDLAPFASDRTNYWAVDTYNRGNVAASAVVLDDDLADSSARVHQITTTATTPAATIEYTITDDGTTLTPGTATGSYVAPAGSWITSARVTSGVIPAVNVLPSDTGGALFRVAFHYELLPGAALGTWTNSASATVTYPAHPEIAPIEVNSSRTVTLRALPEVSVTPAFSAAIPSAVVTDGGQAVPGSAVTYTVRGSTSGIPADAPVSPQYVFIAPAGWEIQNGSAAFAAGSVPPGAAFVYRDVTIGGVERQAVVASWPTGTTFGSNVVWPNMTVIATPTFAVAAGTNSVATFWAGDSLNRYGPDGVTWGGRVIDTPDVDADGNTTEAFASATNSILVSGSDRIDVIKEICVETADGCNWVSNPDIIVGVAPDAEDITYRVTLRNGGNTTLSSIVGYDILPFVGDSRGSTFGETLNEVTATSANVTLQYSDSSNPCREEVAPGLPSCDPDWTADATGASSIRAMVDGSLAPGAEASFTFAANVVPGAAADAVACNSVAVDTANTVASEPRPVCATTQEADLAISVPDRLPLQAGRPGVVPFTVTNLGGSEAAPATVEIEVPDGIRITSLAPAGWSCEASETQPDGSVLGPVTLSCDAVTETGSLRMLALDEPNALDLPAVIPDDALVGEDTCFPAIVSGLMSDPELGNNEDASCFAVLAGDALIGVTKDDGLDEVRIGDEITYSIDVSNLLVGESLEAVTITDVLPANLAFVSASAGGQITGQGAPDADGNLPGGTVTWTLPSLAAAGEPGDGEVGEGAAGSEQTVTVTVRVLQAAEVSDEIVNEATVSAADPANPDVQLTDADGDTDALLRAPAIQLVKSASPTTVSAVGDAVSYEFLVTNSGDVTLTDVAVTETAFTGTGDPLEVVCPADVLAPQDSVTCTADYQVTQADLDAGVVSNTATATGIAPEGLDAPVSVPSTAVVTADLAAALSLVKTATPETAAAAGDEIAYEFVVTNEGNVSVSDVAIVEGEFTGDPAQLSDIVCDSDGAIAPDASVTCEATYTLTQADVDAGSVSNTATATADAPGAVADPASESSSAVVTIPAAAALSLEKTVSETTTADEAGETVTYLFDVSNTGNVTVSGIAIEERAFSGAGDPVSVACPEESLAPDAEMTCVGTYVLVQADVDAGGLDNTAAASGLAPGDAPVESEESTADLVIEADAALRLEKSASSGELVVDEEITYSFVVTNTGNVTVTDVAIDELAFTGTGDLSSVICGPAAAALAPDAQVICEATYAITQADVDAGTVDNTAAAVGASPAGAVTSEPSSAQLPFDQDPAVELVKTTDSEGYSSVGEAIDYLFRVTNTGNVTLDAVSIVEQEFSGTGTLSDIECSASALVPGEFLDCAASYEVTQADIDAGELSNTAIAEAVAPGETPVVSAASTATVPFVGATDLALVKSGEGVDANGDGVVTAGDTIRWTFAVTNTGASTLTALEIVDPKAGAVVCDATVLPPGASIDCAAAEYRITAADAAAGRVVNTATATALGAGGLVVVSGEATAVVEVAAEPPLATTGGQLSVWLIVVAILVLIAGAVALWIARTRRRTTE